MNTTSGDVVFEVRGVSFRYHGAVRDAVSNVDLAVPVGGMLSMIGPNGSGKSTLLRLMLGALEPDAGAVRFTGRPLPDWRRDDLARRIGVVAQGEEFAFPLTVRELVSMGRYPHLGAWRREAAADRAAIDDAMERCGVIDMAGRSVLELSGGERQRARLARALAQHASTLVFDEPTASLDIAHEMSLFDMLAELRACGTTIVVVTHNINLAARYADTLVMLDRGSVAAAGSPSEVITRQTVEAVYGWPITITSHDGAPQVVPEKRESTNA